MRLTDAPLDRSAARGEAPAPPAGRRTRLLIVAMVAGTLWLAAIFGRHGLLEVVRYRQERDRLQQEIARLEKQQVDLQREIKSLRTDPLALERLAREELNMARPGEVVVLLDPPRDTSAPVPAQRPAPPPVGAGSP